MIIVNNDIHIDFDVLTYLTTHLPSHFEPASDVEYRGCCLWHDERNPSLYVNVETGNFFCHACHAKGNVVRLVQRISRFPTYYDALTWLVERYGVNVDRDDAETPFTLRFTEIESSDVQTIDSAIADRYTFATTAYMTEKRGIPTWVLREFNVGYDESSNSVTIPWYDRHGGLLTVKHRSIDDKRFWYEPRCKALKHTLYGLHRCIGADVVYIVEGEIDALTLVGAGKRAVAIGGSHMNDAQARELLLAGVQAVVPCCDRDAAGHDANERISSLCRNIGIDVFTAIWPRDDVKDANEAGVEACKRFSYEIPKIFF